jgi:hypothetical protein
MPADQEQSWLLRETPAGNGINLDAVGSLALVSGLGIFLGVEGVCELASGNVVGGSIRLLGSLASYKTASAVINYSWPKQSSR